MKKFLKKLLRKGFQVELEDQYRYPRLKGFQMADALVMQAALENHCIENGWTIRFLRKEDPIQFVLDGKERYTAKLEMGFGRGNHGYHIHCMEIVDDTPWEC